MQQWIKSLFIAETTQQFISQRVLNFSYFFALYLMIVGI